MRITGILAGAAVLALGAHGAEAGETYDAVKEKGFIQCGVNGSGLPGFGIVNDEGQWEGLDVDFCKAMAAAVFGDPEAVKYTPLTAKERFTALQSGEVDVLSRNTTWTATRDSSLGLDFVGINYYDGQGFLIPAELGVNSALELDGASVCVQTGTTTELNLADFFRENNMEYEAVVFETTNELLPAYLAGRCDVFTTDRSGLYAERTKFDDPSAHIILPEVISKEPLGPVVRHGDNEWGDVARWTLMTMLEAEELGVTSENVDEMRDTSGNPNIRRMLGAEGEIGEGLGLPADFGYQIVSNIGNYGESFERNVGSGSELQIDRGINAQWKDGGLMYAFPIR